MSQSKKTYGVYILTGLLPIAIFLHPSFGLNSLLHESVLSVLPYLPYIGFAIAGILGWKLNQTRILFTALFFLGACYAMVHPELFVSLKIGTLELNQILCIGVPLMLATTFMTKESRFWNIRNLGRILFLLSPLLIIAGWFALSPGSFQNMASRDLLSLGKFLFIPQLSFISVSVLGFIAILSRDEKIKPFIYATLITLIPFMSAAQVGMSDGAANNLATVHTLASFSIASFIHLHAIFTMYWQRVYIDELTQIPNRRALDERLQTLAGEYVIAMVDIDHFKSFNDKYGHDEGDNVLRLVGAVMNKELGKAYRYGGEEFFAVFEGDDYEMAAAIADKARKKLEKRDFFIRPPKKLRKSASKKNRGMAKGKGKKVRVTVSIGLAGSSAQRHSPQDVMKCADKALYKAKNQGRNRVIMSV